MIIDCCTEPFITYSGDVASDKGICREFADQTRGTEIMGIFFSPHVSSKIEMICLFRQMVIYYESITALSRSY